MLRVHVWRTTTLACLQVQPHWSCKAQLASHMHPSSLSFFFHVPIRSSFYPPSPSCPSIHTLPSIHPYMSYLFSTHSQTTRPPIHIYTHPPSHPPSILSAIQSHILLSPHPPATCFSIYASKQSKLLITWLDHYV